MDFNGVLQGIKEFFRLSKKKLCITIGLFVFSVILMYLSAEFDLSFLRPAYSYLFNWSELTMIRYTSPILIIPLRLLQMYIYSCCYCLFRAHPEYIKPSLKIAGIAIALVAFYNMIYFFVFISGCFVIPMPCVPEGGIPYSSADPSSYTEPALKIPLTCDQTCFKGGYYDLLSRVIFGRIIIPLILIYIALCIVFYWPDAKEVLLVLAAIAVLLLIITGISSIAESYLMNKYMKPAVSNRSMAITCPTQPAEKVFYLDMENQSDVQRIYDGAEYFIVLNDVAQSRCLIEVQSSRMYPFNDFGMNMTTGENYTVMGVTLRVLDASPDDKSCQIEILSPDMDVCSEEEYGQDGEGYEEEDGGFDLSGLFW